MVQGLVIEVAKDWLAPILTVMLKMIGNLNSQLTTAEGIIQRIDAGMPG